jgi:hypothetical protein
MISFRKEVLSLTSPFIAQLMATVIIVNYWWEDVMDNIKGSLAVIIYHCSTDL